MSHVRLRHDLNLYTMPLSSGSASHRLSQPISVSLGTHTTPILLLTNSRLRPFVSLSAGRNGRGGKVLSAVLLDGVLTEEEVRAWRTSSAGRGM